MTDKYETRCWLCHSTDLELDARGMRCLSCGATYNLIPKPGILPTTQEDVVDYKDGKSYRYKSRRPSHIVQKRAAKARGDR